MPRGKNYVNNNKGMSLQAHGKKRENMVECFYGAGCTRPGCIYKHPPGMSAAAVKPSKEPCMAFLAGQCAFGKGCQKRHPGKEEVDRLREKYSKVKCRFGDNCRTNGCLYQHLGDEPYKQEEPVAYIMPPQHTMQRPAQMNTIQQHPLHPEMMQQPQQFRDPQQQEQLYYKQQQQLYYQQQQIQKQALWYQQAQQRRKQQQMPDASAGTDPNEFPSLYEAASKNDT